MRQLQTITHRVLVCILFLSILSGFRCPASEPADAVYSTDTPTGRPSAAFEILKAKCNGCHARQNPGKVFTMANMNSLAPDINEQVFVKKRMPRGNKIRLTEDEYTTLKTWLVTQNIK